ncbi:MAG: hypothetical protein ACP5HM_15865 [Anaerolineae bacterium]
MRKVKFVSVFVLLALLLSAGPGVALAQKPGPEAGPEVMLSPDTCSGKGTDEQIQALAKLALEDQVSGKALGCYEALSAEGKARVFEAVAEQRGILQELDEETRWNKVAMEQNLSKQNLPREAMPLGGQVWEQLIEHRVLVSGERITANRWWVNHNCDGDPGDKDYQLRFDFPTAVTDPDEVGTYSWDLLVDAMLWYYQVKYGGVKGWGHTAWGRMYTCIGDKGVENAGGIDNVYSDMIVHKETIW